MTRRLVGGGAWAVAGRLVMGGASVGISVILARTLPSEEMGAYLLMLSMTSVLALCAGAGLEKTALRIVAARLGSDSQSSVHRVLVAIYALACCSTAVVAGLLWFGGGRWLGRELFESSLIEGAAALLAPWVAVVTFETLVAETLRGLHDIRLATVFGGTSTRFLTLVLLACLWWTHMTLDLERVVLLSIVAGCVSVLAAARSLSKRVAAVPGRSDEVVSAAALLSSTWPLLVSNVLLFMLGQVDLWIMGIFRPEDEVAVYGVSVRLVLLVSSSLTIANAVLPPIIGELHARRDARRLERVARLTATVAALPSAVVLVAFLFLGRPLLGALFGAPYRDGATILALLSIGQLANVWAGSCGYVLIMAGRQKDLALISAVTGIVSVVGGVILVRPWAGIGVATATATAIILQQILMLATAKRRCGVWTHASVVLLAKELRSRIRRVHATPAD